MNSEEFIQAIRPAGSKTGISTPHHGPAPEPRRRGLFAPKATRRLACATMGAEKAVTAWHHPLPEYPCPALRGGTQLREPERPVAACHHCPRTACKVGFTHSEKPYSRRRKALPAGAPCSLGVAPPPPELCAPPGGTGGRVLLHWGCGSCLRRRSTAICGNTGRLLALCAGYRRCGL